MENTGNVKMEQWLGQRISECIAEADRLRKDLRQDEAILETVRGNVYEIVRTVFSTFREDTGRFLEKMQQITDTWERSGNLAQQHGEYQKTTVEQIKLEAAREALAMFRSLQEG